MAPIARARGAGTRATILVPGAHGDQPMIVQVVRWKSRLPEAEIVGLFEARAARYRAVPGLVQKHYLRYRTGEYGAVYLWESEEALATFRASDLGQGMADVFAIEGEKDVRLADVALTLHPERLG
jgi:hypothetical protein